MWYEWNSLNEFNAWHTAICSSLGIPDEQTTDYTKAFEIESKWIAVVHNSEAAGLTPTDLRLPVRVVE